MATRKAVIIDSAGSLAENVTTDAVSVGHLAGTTGTPGISGAGIVLGAGGVTLVGNDLTGIITVAIGLVGGTLTITVTPNSPYPSAPQIQIQPANSNAAAAVLLGMPYPTNSGTGSWQVVVPLNVSQAGLTLVFNYFAIS